ncbi:hypothetical protein tb265_32370 [Gemmatimonadetes bacterium T265]|nr:hypothetical protein tb265_32370 [Gemmatimonadetes bacterium T265]
MPLQRALLLLIITTLLAGIVPAGVVIDRRLAREVEARARDDLAHAPRMVADRDLVLAEGLVMHARDVAHAPGLADAVARGDRAAAVRVAEAARGAFGDAVVIVTASGGRWAGPDPGAMLVDATRRGQMPVSVVSDSGALHSVTLAPVMRGGVWLGAAGVSVALGRPAAGILAALTRADVLILGARGALTASTTPDTVARVIARHAGAWPRDGQVREVRDGARRYLVATAPVGDVATLVFVRDLTRDLAVLPAFRRVVVLSGVAAVLLGLLLGTTAARRLARPVTVLAGAADRLAAGDVGAPLTHSRIREITRLSDAFDAMRRALVARLAELTLANRELADRQARLEAAQSEILQRERLAVSSRLVAELAHEIRNPIANLRNCLEIVRRRVDHDPQGREFADLAIDELLRMHELAEQLLDLNRPRDPAVRVCDVDVVVREVAVLASAALVPDALRLDVVRVGGPVRRAAIAPDALKQVLLNLVQNAREALADPSHVRSAPGRIAIGVRSDGRTVTIEVADDGPGMAADVLRRAFDPFFTTKGAVHGVGLGLFVAAGLVRGAGGRLTAANRPEGGARFRVELPVAPEADAAAEDGVDRSNAPGHGAPLLEAR